MEQDKKVVEVKMKKRTTTELDNEVKKIKNSTKQFNI